MQHRLRKERRFTAQRTAAALGVGAAALLVSPALANATQITTTSARNQVADQTPRAVPAAALKQVFRHLADETPGLPTPGGPNDGDNSPDAPGAPTPGAPAPAPAPKPQRNFDGPGTIPPPPSVAPTTNWSPPSYVAPYTPLIPFLRPPRPVKPRPEVKPPPGKIRVGNLITDIPPGMADSDVRSINRWSAFTESQIATQLVSIGVPEGEASRRAAATVLGVAIGAGAAGLPASALGALLGIGPGMIVGGIGGAIAITPLTMALTPFLGPAAPSVATPLAVGGGIVLGGAAGAAGGALLLGIPAAIIGGTVGGLLAYLLGAGDPGSDPGTVRNPGDPEAEGGFTLPAPNPKANQYELALGNTGLPGGPEVKYVVRTNGDVRGNVSVAGVKVPFGWSAEAADAPYRSLGFLSETGREAVKGLVYSTGIDAINKIPGLQISYPQSVKPGQKAPTNGRLGQAEIDRQKEQQQARERAIDRAQNQSPQEQNRNEQGDQAPKSAPAKPAPTVNAPKRNTVATVTPKARPKPVDPIASTVQQVQKAVQDLTAPHHKTRK